ncbi:MAG TPA: type VI secretion system tip protein VgrG, partial [Candidatus Aquabacterium excrementipullorum]|nr:type VI secretion system tip protein VgrG [Candidatus Aquabacterium excrementipullorum]
MTMPLAGQGPSWPLPSAPPSGLASALSPVLSLLGITFDDATRLYRLQGAPALDGLLVEAWALREALNEPWELELSVLSTSAHVPFTQLPGQPLSLLTRLSDGKEHTRSGLVTRAARLDSDGGLTRYRLIVRPWLALLAHTTRSQVWQECAVVDIVESIFARYQRFAAWRWADDVADHLAQSPANRSNEGEGRGLRSYTMQYRQSDLGMVQRLLSEEGLSYRFEQDEAAPMGHRLVIFADSANADSCPEDATSSSALGGSGIRFHRAAAVEVQDAIQALAQRIEGVPDKTTLSSWDYKARRMVTGCASTDWPRLRREANGLMADAPEASITANTATASRPFGVLEDYRTLPPYAFATSAQADRAALLRQQAHECRWEQWMGRSSVRTLACGTHFAVTQSTLDELSIVGVRLPADLAARSFVLTSLTQAGINNLPKDASQRIAAGMGRTGAEVLPAWVDQALRQQAADHGHGNHFTAVRRHRPWRPKPLPKDHADTPSIEGVLTATVVDLEGATGGAQEIAMDRLGRIRIAFDFQREDSGLLDQAAPRTSPGSTWVRVAQSLTGPGMGMQFIPRVGQEVLVGFQHGCTERPVVLGALYNGRGEGGVVPTPGGQALQGSASGAGNDEVFAQSGDHRPSAQGNLIGSGTGGHSPAWHGAAAGELAQGGQRNAAALSGFKTQGFGLQAEHYNQLVFDDSDDQLRVQLATTQHATQLNMGHLIHQADNHRGSFRGEGFELRTDAYGAIRASRGVMLSTYGLIGAAGHTGSAEPAGDNVAGMALARRMFLLGQAMSEAARTHQTVQLSSHIGTHRANACALNDQQAPNQALHTALSGMVEGRAQPLGGGLEQALSDAASGNTEPKEGQVPHATDPLVTMVAKAGIAMVAGQDIQVAAGEGITLASGGDTHIATAGAARLHTGQAIGMLAGAIEPGTQAVGRGLTMIASQGDVNLQAHGGPMQVAAKGLVEVMSRSAHVDWAAAKRIVIATAGGASVTIEGGNITVECPATLTIKAGKKSFVGPERVDVKIEEFPDATSSSLKRKARFELNALPGPAAINSGYAGEPYRLYADGRLLQKGVADERGAVLWEHQDGVKTYRIELVSGQSFEVEALETLDTPAQKLANQGFRAFKHDAEHKAAGGAE